MVVVLTSVHTFPLGTPRNTILLRHEILQAGCFGDFGLRWNEPESVEGIGLIEVQRLFERIVGRWVGDLES